MNVNHGNILKTIRNLPDGTKGRVIQEANALVETRHPLRAQYASEKILYYDAALWMEAYLRVITVEEKR